MFPCQGATGIIAVAPWPSGREWHLCAHVFVCVTGIFAATHLGLIGWAAGRQDSLEEGTEQSARQQKDRKTLQFQKSIYTGLNSVIKITTSEPL